MRPVIPPIEISLMIGVDIAPDEKLGLIGRTDIAAFCILILGQSSPVTWRGAVDMRSNSVDWCWGPLAEMGSNDKRDYSGGC